MHHVWIVEDDFRVAQIHQDFVQAMKGFKVTENIRMGNELIEKLAQAEQLPAIILTDLYIPDVEKGSLITHIRQKYPAIYVIVISAATEVALIKEVVHLGIFDYIIKPFEQQRLEQAFNKYKQTIAIYQQSANVTQRDLDSLFYNAVVNKIVEDETFVKGIDAHTLQTVKDIFEKEQQNELTASQLSELIGSSRSTARRYLEYLVSEQFLEMISIYGSVGRPERKYVYRGTYEQN
ncbi:response regulator [Metasolibacillus meyeri]|uniref:response regulator n=1 Tax=Metasolibacillus meyeri TaxID=1071052 RepID=UPI000D30768B|nr:response regulator [Metasolibacillus meyeri]